MSRGLKFELIALLAILIFALLWGLAYAQKTCAPISGSTLQTCTVTITIQPAPVDATHGAATSFRLFRKDGTGAFTQIATTSALSLQNVFNDAGNVDHDYNAIAVNSAGPAAASPIVSWITPSIVPTNYVTITTDKAVTVSHCPNENCPVKLSAPKSTRVTVNGKVR